MPGYNIEFTEKDEYAYSVALVRARESRLVDTQTYISLTNASGDRFVQLLSEVTGIRFDSDESPQSMVLKLEENFTETFFLIKSLIQEDAYKRLISLKYDYELLKKLVKNPESGSGYYDLEVSKRSNYSLPILKVLLENEKQMDIGPHLYMAYYYIKTNPDLTGGEIDTICDISYFKEVFEILAEYPNEFLIEYYRSLVDISNILTVLRAKAREIKRSEMRRLIIPFGTLSLDHLEHGYDLSVDALGSRLVFWRFSSILKQVDKSKEVLEQIEELEKLFEEALVKYLRESIFVVFGIEPVFRYLWLNELQLKNLRVIVLLKSAGVEPGEIRKYVRGVYG